MLDKEHVDEQKVDMEKSVNISVFWIQNLIIWQGQFPEDGATMLMR